MVVHSGAAWAGIESNAKPIAALARKPVFIRISPSLCLPVDP
jgi:hypothetical protein